MLIKLNLYIIINNPIATLLEMLGENLRAKKKG